MFCLLNMMFASAAVAFEFSNQAPTGVNPRSYDLLDHQVWLAKTILGRKDRGGRRSPKATLG